MGKRKMPTPLAPEVEALTREWKVNSRWLGVAAGELRLKYAEHTAVTVALLYADCEVGADRLREAFEKLCDVSGANFPADRVIRAAEREIEAKSLLMKCINFLSRDKLRMLEVTLLAIAKAISG